MDADLREVLKRLAERRNEVETFEFPWNPPNLCTAEMTTFLKETTNGTAA